mmetsp:Transcript_29939/g.55294  ORF Transcript_29939/g.55294 Transcript_29939/m.55294 type:complete len:198 (-) Transcript_29939:10-603(-)
MRWQRFLAVVAFCAISASADTEGPLENDEYDSDEIAFIQHTIKTGKVMQAVKERVASDANKTSNLSLSELFVREIIFEMSDAQRVSTKSKVMLAVLEGLGFTAMLGIDRCYMGQALVGIIKGITFGGFGIWALVDFVAITINMFQQKDSIQSLGYNASFWPKDAVPAMWIMIAFLAIYALAACCGPRKQQRKNRLAQ